MSYQTPRIDPQQISTSGLSMFRLIGKVISQSINNEITISSPTLNNKMIELTHVRVSQVANLVIEKWYEFVCRMNDSGDSGFLVLDAVECKLPPGEDISVDGIVALQQLTKKFPNLY